MPDSRALIRHCGTQRVDEDLMFSPIVVRQAYVCPECDAIKDAWEPETQSFPSRRWCHNYPFHETRAHRLMKPTVVTRYLSDEEAKRHGV